MLEAYRAGGWAMVPTTVMGVLLVVAAVLYALRPERRRVALLLCLSLLTLLCGCLGFTMGFIGTLAVASSGRLPEPPGVILMSGTRESLYNVAQALVFLTLSMIIIADGALRLWRGTAAVGEREPAAESD